MAVTTTVRTPSVEAQLPLIPHHALQLLPALIQAVPLRSSLQLSQVVWWVLI